MDYLVVSIKSKDKRQEQEFKEVTLLENSACDKRLVQGEANKNTGWGREPKSALTAAPTPCATFLAAAAISVVYLSAALPDKQ